jgi:putative ABC transport system substrate-binding protein
VTLWTTWPLAARAQQAKPPTVGILVLGSPPPDRFLNELRTALRDIGLSEGRNLKLEIRSAEGRAVLLPEKAAELVRLKVDVIVAYQTPTATAAKQATSEIPIVMSGVGDPVGTGLVASLARPGGNVTGTSAGVVEVAGKSVGLIRELLPSARRVAVLANEADPLATPYLAEIERIARGIGMDIAPVMARSARPLDPAFAAMAAEGADAFIIQGSLVNKDAADLAIKHRLPSVGPTSWARSGGLMAYSADFAAFVRETATYVDKILKGAKPADLPVAFPTKFELVINLKTAQAIGLDVSPVLVARADEVIE